MLFNRHSTLVQDRRRMHCCHAAQNESIRHQKETADQHSNDPRETKKKTKKYLHFIN
jgi:hypothetical protein